MAIVGLKHIKMTLRDEKLIIGIDGGGTKTSSILFDDNGITIDELECQGSNLYVYGEEGDTQSVLQQLQILQKDIKTLEKAVYNQSSTRTSGGEQISNNNDVLTQHLLKLSDLEEQFKILTNNFEEINFKLDKLSNRITKVQTDNQMRFQD